MQGLVVDLFAGGGGASEGLRLALGRDPDIAINHDPDAVAMHMANHPNTLHLTQDVWRVPPLYATKGRPVDILWASPDCTHFSKAKGGKPRDQGIRDLAWVVIEWAKAARPKMIFLENVEEFSTWGPLDAAGYCIKEKSGRTFDRWVRTLRALGYTVDWRELRACDYGAPTIRKRLFLVARRDGLPIVWPRPTHGPEGSGLLPWRTAAECIDWRLPCPSIFLTREEAAELRRQTGIICKRPLAENTMKRIARGTWKYVINAAEPFVVTYYGPKGDAEFRGQGLDEPLKTQTAANRHGLVMPFVQHIQHSNMTNGVMPGNEPLRTITAYPRGGSMAVVAPFISKINTGAVGSSLDEPLHTITAGGNPKRPSTGGTHALVAAFLAKHHGTTIAQGLDEPLHTITGKPKHSLVAAHLVRHFGRSVGQSPLEPNPTTTAGGGGKTGLVTSHLVKMKGTNIGQDHREPVQTITAGGFHFGEVRAFLMKYYGAGTGQSMNDPMATATAKERFGLVTVAGEDYAIADIGLRMLTPRELFLAQGFPPTYQIDRGADGKKLIKAAQVRLVGNSVCPPIAAAIVSANLPAEQRQEAA